MRLVWEEGRTTYVPALALKMHLNGVHDAPVLAVERENFGVQGRALRMGWQWCKAEGDNGTRGRPRAQAKGADPPDRGTYAGGHDEEEGYKKDLSVSLHSLKRDSVTMFTSGHAHRACSREWRQDRRPVAAGRPMPSAPCEQSSMRQDPGDTGHSARAKAREGRGVAERVLRGAGCGQAKQVRVRVRVRSVDGVGGAHHTSPVPPTAPTAILQAPRLTEATRRWRRWVPERREESGKVATIIMQGQDQESRTVCVGCHRRGPGRRLLSVLQLGASPRLPASMSAGALATRRQASRL